MLASGYSCLGIIHLLTHEDDEMGLGFFRAAEYLGQCPSYNRYVFHQYINSCASLYISSVQPGSPPGQFEININKLTPILKLLERQMKGYLIHLDDLARCELLLYRCQYEEAAGWAIKAAYGTRKKKHDEMELRALMYLLRIYIARGKEYQFGDILKRLETLCESCGSARERKIADLVHAWYYLQLGEPNLVAEWIKLDFEDDGEEDNFISTLLAYVKSRLLLAQKNYIALNAYISAKRDDFLIARHLLGTVDLLAVKAVALLYAGERSEALSALAEAYELAAPEGIQASFVELGSPMRALCKFARQRKDCAIPTVWLDLIAKKCSAYAKRTAFLLAAFQKERGETLHALSTLSFREREVLRCLSQGLTREEIAIVNHVSLDTVKSELKSVYAKLHAVNRADAVRIALMEGHLWEA
jgi:LuxR family maltose regulon positive regulatory protein